jgi:hypothetical protein
MDDSKESMREEIQRRKKTNKEKKSFLLFTFLFICPFLVLLIMKYTPERNIFHWQTTKTYFNGLTYLVWYFALKERIFRIPDAWIFF